MQVQGLVHSMVYKTKDYSQFVLNNNYNRDISLNNVKRIKKSIQTFGDNGECFPIVIDEKGVIIDGQHRIKAIKLAYEENINIKIKCLEYEVESVQEMIEIFQVRNKSMEIPEYYVNSFGEDKRILRSFERKLREMGGCFNDKRNRPNIIVKEFMNSLKNSNLLNEIRDVNSFEIFLNNVNKKIKKKLKDQNFVKKNKISETMIEKCEEWNHYYGLIKNFSYLENIY